MTMKGCHYIISGRVQGVFFRANTLRKAIELNLTGWVRNSPDGEVEVQAFGSTEALELLQSWLWHGPPAAKVTEVKVQEIPWQTFREFSIR